MFIDEKILKIVARSANLNPGETIQLAFWYSSKILDSITYAGLEYFLEKDKSLYINNTDELKMIVDKIFIELKNDKDKELAKKISNEIDDLNRDIMKFFLTSASYGDRLYLKVYLASQIKNLRQKIQNKALVKQVNFLPSKSIETPIEKLGQISKLK